MSDTATQTDARRVHRKLTQEELAAEARAQFGDDPLNWAFQCPVCGDIATAAEFPPAQRERISQECIGRHRDALAKLAAFEFPGVRALPDDRGCDFAAYGLIPGPWEIELPDGKTVRCFPLAPTPQQPAESAGEEPEKADAEHEGGFAYWALWIGDPLTLDALHEFDTACTAAEARVLIEQYDAGLGADLLPWTTGASYLLEPLTAPRLRMLRRLALGDDPVTWADAHGFEVADQGVGCRHCGLDLLGHPGQAVGA